MIKKLKTVLNAFLFVCKDLFAFSLILYLLFFILEIFFPGFVTNNFNLNWVLLIVLVLGIFTAFSPIEAEVEGVKEKPKVIDYFLVIFLAVIGAGLIFYKMGPGGFSRWLVSIFSGILISVFGLVIMTSEGEEREEVEIEEAVITGEQEESFLLNRFSKNFWLFLKPIFLKKINFPIIPLLLFVIFASVLIPKNIDFLVGSFTKRKEVKVESYPTLLPKQEPEFWDDLAWLQPEIKSSEDIFIQVLNGGAEKGSAKNFAEVLKKAGFKKVVFGDADSSVYKNATIRFRPEDKEQASLVKRYLRQEYVIISEAPSGTSSAEIIVILGPEELGEIEEGTGFE